MSASPPSSQYYTSDPEEAAELFFASIMTPQPNLPKPAYIPRDCRLHPNAGCNRFWEVSHRTEVAHLNNLTKSQLVPLLSDLIKRSRGGGGEFKHRIVHLGGLSCEVREALRVILLKEDYEARTKLKAVEKSVPKLRKRIDIVKFLGFEAKSMKERLTALEREIDTLQARHEICTFVLNTYRWPIEMAIHRLNEVMDRQGRCDPEWWWPGFIEQMEQRAVENR